MMKFDEYKPRIIDDTMRLYLDTFGAVLIEGPKWCGKTWTGKYHSSSEFLVADPKDNFNNKKLAMMLPELALEGASPHLIDEWQEIPPLWDAVRSHVDANPGKGQFILTGSTLVDKHSYIHSGTGRIAHLKMRTMSLYESGHSDGKISLQDICNNQAKNIFTGEVDLRNLVRLVIAGGWPSNDAMSLKQSELVAKEYVKSLLSEDIFKIDGIKRDVHKIELLLRSLARNESTTATNTLLKRDIKSIDYDDINLDTVTDYLNLFNRLYFIENLPPYALKFRSSMRVKQSEKRHFVDPSLPCAILHLSEEKLLNDLEFFGFLFESMVLRDLLTYVDSFGAKLYHYQDYGNNEMDAVIELENGDWCGIEIKLGSNQIDEAASNLIKINSSIIKEHGKAAQSLCVICGLSNAAYRRDDGVYVVPITSLKP